MIIVFKPNITKKAEAAVLKEIKRLGYRPHIMRGVARTVVGAIGDELTHQSLENLITQFPQAVESVMPVQKRFKLVSREAHPANSTINVRGIVIGGRKIQIMAGPCSVESERQLLTTAHAVKGATILRGGAFKPRTSPYEFQGLGKRGLKLLAKARNETGLAIITELLSEDHAQLSRNTRTSSRSGRVTRRTFNSSLPPPGPAGRFCSNAVCRCASRNGCSPANTFSRTTIPT